MKRMSHPLHGFTHAHNTNEVAYLSARGWSVIEETKPEGKNEEEPAKLDQFITQEDYFTSLKILYEAKFGKKPHHMAKLETIKKALDDNS